MKSKKIVILFTVIFTNYSVFSMGKTDQLKSLVLEGTAELEKIFENGSQDRTRISDINIEIETEIAHAAQKKEKQELLKCLYAKRTLASNAFELSKSDHFKETAENVNYLIYSIVEDQMDDALWKSLAEKRSIAVDECVISK